MWLREVFKPMKIFTTVILLTALVTPLEAQWLQRRTAGIPRAADGKPNLTAAAPRTADGKPDLAGLWEMIGAVRRPGDGADHFPQTREIGLAIGGARRCGGKVRFAIGSARDAGRATLQPLRLERRHQGSQKDYGCEDLHRLEYLP